MRCFEIIILLLLGSVSSLVAVDQNASGQVPSPDEVSLEMAMDYALQNSLTILRAKERIKEQYGLTLEARAAALPEISLRGSINDQQGELTFFQPHSDDWTVSLQVRQSIYRGGRRKSGLRARYLQQQAAFYDLQANVETTIRDVKIRFYGVLLARERIQLERQNVKLLEVQLANVQSQFESGTVPKLDVLQAKVALSNVRPALIRARHDFHISVAELKQVAGYVKDSMDVAWLPEFTGDLEIAKKEYPLLDSMARALRKRPELKQQELIVDARSKGVRVAKSDYWPSLSLLGRYDMRRSFSADHDIFEAPVDGWFVGFESNWKLWDSGATKGQVLQAKSRLRQDELMLDEIRLSIEVEVRQAISELEHALELVEVAFQMIGQAEEALRLANERYNVGNSTLLDTLQAHTALAEARNNQLHANHSYLVAVAKVQRAIGETKYRFAEEGSI